MYKKTAIFVVFINAFWLAATGLRFYMALFANGRELAPVFAAIDKNYSIISAAIVALNAACHYSVAFGGKET